MSNIAVIYKSKYGHTKQYAKWLAQELNAVLSEAREVKPAQLASYDTVIYGGGLYAGGIDGVKLVTENPTKRLVVFTVGVFDPKTTDYSAVLSMNFTPETLPKIKLFHLRGGYDHKQLGLFHKAMMSVAKGRTLKKDKAEFTAEDNEFLRIYGTKTDFMDKCAIEPIVEYVRGLC